MALEVVRWYNAVCAVLLSYIVQPLEMLAYIVPNFKAMVDDGLYNPLLQQYELHNKYNCYIHVLAV